MTTKNEGETSRLATSRERGGKTSPAPVVMLAEIKARAERATPGPWETRSNLPYTSNGIVIFSDRFEKNQTIGRWPDLRVYKAADNVDFIAHARTDIPALVATVEAQAAELDKLKEHNARLVKSVDKQAALLHPHYGPCDGFADGGCAECEKQVAGLRQERDDEHLRAESWANTAENYHVLYTNAERTLAALRELLKECSDQMWRHHEIGFVRRAYEQYGGTCEICENTKIFDRVEAALGRATKASEVL